MSFRQNAVKILRKGKAKSTPTDFQEVLGVTVPIPQDVLGALGLEDTETGLNH